MYKNILSYKNNYSVIENLVSYTNCRAMMLAMMTTIIFCNNFAVIKITLFIDDIFTLIYDELIIAINLIK